MGFFNIFSSQRNKRLYFDFASSTPVDSAMLSSFPKLSAVVVGANPSALHAEGVSSRQALLAARTLVAKTLGAQVDEIVFTGNATESDTLALVGSVRAFINKGIAPSEITVYHSAIEHAAITESASALFDAGVTIKTLSATEGVVEPKDILVPLDTKAIVVSVMYVNNEIGTVQPIKEIAKRIRFLRKHNPGIEIIFHVDATQAPLHFSLLVPPLGIDMMTLGATKLYCPKGVGMLYVRRGIVIEPLFFGGGQERGLRPGTPAVSLIHDFAHALSFAQQQLQVYTEKIMKLQSYFEAQLRLVPGVVISVKDSPRTPHITHIALSGFDSELLVLELDARGIAVSAKSACKNEMDTESDIVRDLYGPNVGAVRFSFGRTTTKKQIDSAIAALKNVCEKYKIA